MRMIVSGAFLILVGCSGRAATKSTWSGPPPEVVKALQTPENPYRIIYNPPVDLTKRPDTSVAKPTRR